MIKKVVIGEGCFGPLMASSIEAYPKETTGFLIGKNDQSFINNKLKPCLRLLSALPLVTAKRCRSSVGIENWKSYYKTRNSFEIIGFNIVGGYHTHPEDMFWMEDLDDTRDLSESDKEFIMEEFQELKEAGIEPERPWLEIVISVGEKEYDTQHEIGWAPLQSTRKRPIPPLLAGRLKLPEKLGEQKTDMGYTFILEGFVCNLKGTKLDVKQVPLHL